jgi:hypothetical protein
MNRIDLKKSSSKLEIMTMNKRFSKSGQTELFLVGGGGGRRVHDDETRIMNPIFRGKNFRGLWRNAIFLLNMTIRSHKLIAKN